MKHSVLVAAALSVLLHSLLAEPIHTNDHVAPQDFKKKYKFLYFAFDNFGSHTMHIIESGRVLALQGHQVTFLVGSDGLKTPKSSDALFSLIVFKSRYTAEDRREIFRELARVSLTGRMSTLWGIAGLMYENIASGKPIFIDMLVDECDALLGDKETMERLRQERFDMLVADDFSLCNPILAQALEIPFVQAANMGPIPEKYGPWFGVPTNPSYIPGHTMGFTDKMTLSQRIKNSVYHHSSVLMFDNFVGKYQPLKIKYGIKPEIDMLKSFQQAKLWFFNTNYPLEFPRPLQPNTIMITPLLGSMTKQKVADDVAKFVDTASAGVVLFSLGSYTESMETEQAQMFADGFAMLPQQVLWQTGADLTEVRLGDNTKIVKWIPLAQLMTHKNTKALVTHGGTNSVLEAMEAGLPIVGLPLRFEQFDHMDRAVARGFAVSLNDITAVTSESLRKAISTVVNDPKFRENAQRASLILKDLTGGTPPAETVAHWILHVTKFGGDHLRPAVLDLSFVERNLLDVYLILLLFVASTTGAFVMLCYICCSKCRRNRPKQD